MTSNFDTTFTHLEKIAEELNARRNDLTNEVESLNERLKKLNLGVSAWIKFRETQNESISIGYVKHGARWQICIKTQYPSQLNPFGTPEEIVPFGGSPTYLRVDGFKKLDELLLKLANNASEMAKSLEIKKEFGVL